MPNEAVTPVSRICYLTQLILSGDLDPGESRDQVEAGIRELSGVFRRIECQASLGLASAALARGNYYGVLKNLRSLIEIERAILGLNRE